ncbi:hypothetical protein OTU49_013103 [Cherax quadricarinatus]|uniref:Uncharacterized protein n=1 Tax=Cherax quadricarinatus TaxID=27406 RepID=A0AAW0VUI5_CHEQU
MFSMGDSPRHKDSDNQMAAEAPELDNLEWIVYDAKRSFQPVSAWLEEWAPSRVTKDDGIEWIWVRGYNVDDTEKSVCDVENLLEAWNTLEESGRQVNLQEISKLAKMFSVTSGKWMVHADVGGKADFFWKLIVKGIVGGQIPSNTAKISAVSPDERKQVICVYNSDFTNKQEVCLLEKGIRNIGLKCGLSYKPDVYTHIGIYRNNRWNLCPTIYKSVYDILAEESKITTTETFPRTL